MPFLCKGVTSASFKELGKIEDLNVALMPLHKMSAKMPAILRGIFAAQVTYFSFYFFDGYFFETKDTIFS